VRLAVQADMHGRPNDCNPFVDLPVTGPIA
jgi:hypothetical protein